MPEHILVTGGAGFIGTALINHLNDYGYETSSADIEDTHAVNCFSLSGNLLELDRFQQVIQITRPDRVIHLAAQVGRIRGEDDLNHTVQQNAQMTANVASVCGDLGIPLVYASTSEIYGDQGEEVCHEDDGPFGLPHNLYGLSKRWGEEAARLYAPDGLIIWRPSMPYGPGAPPGRGRRAMDNMLWQAEHRMPITVHRGAVRSWCYIWDAVKAMRMTIEHGEAGIYNIGRDDDPRSMLEIAKKACYLANAPEDLIEVVDPPGAQTVVKHLSTEKIRQLGWAPQWDLDDGIKQVYEWIKNFDSEGKLIDA